MRRFAWLLALVSALSMAQTGGGSNPFVTGPPSAATTTALSPEARVKVLDELNKVLSERAFVPGVDFKKWADHIATKKEDLDKAEDHTAFSRVVNEALRTFGLSHLRLQTPRQFSRRGQTSTVGSGMTTEKVEQGLRVRGVMPESPAATAGLARGDVIMKVDGAAPTDSTNFEGEEGKKFKIEVKKESGETKEIEIELKRFSTVRKETLTWPSEDVAVLRVFTFSAGYGRENIEALMKEAGKAKHLVLDLRSNGGGAVNNLNHLLSLLLPDKTPYGAFISKRVAEEYVKANPNGPITPEAIAAWAPTKASTRVRTVEPFKGKIAVLINRGSGSASEIAAAALKEQAGAILVGAPSAGAVLASVFVRLPEGYGIQIPVSDYVTVKGMRLEKNPLKPDHEVTANIQDGKDPVLDKAIESLKAATPLGF